MSSHIPIIADVPTSEPGLGFQEYAAAIAGAIRGGEPARFTIGLYGPWGSGKSSLLNAVAKELTEAGSTVMPVLFDAWRYEKAPHLIIPLLHAMYRAARQDADKSLSSAFLKTIRSVIFGLKFDLGVLSVGFDSKSVKKAWSEEDLVPLDEAFSRPYEELRNLSESLGSRRIAILIDDLDRCSPANVVSVLESINLVMDVPGFIFVLALDYDVLVHAVKERYPHVSPHVFLQKMIQLPFRIPRLDLEHSDFIHELVPDWDRLAIQFPDEFTEELRAIAVLGLKSNPRQVKRFLNSFLLLIRVIQERHIDIDSSLLSRLLALQLGWPTQYLDLQDAVLAEDPDPFISMRQDSEDMALKRFAERFFQRSPSNDRLRQLLQLTKVTSTEEVPESANELSMTEARGRNLLAFPDGLAKKGYHKSSRSNRLYYNPEQPDRRFVLGKHVVRFEKRKGDVWRLWESYRFSDQAHLALQVIDHPDRLFTDDG